MTDTHARPAGLVTLDASHAVIPLAGVSIDADITSLCVQVVISQRYVNRETKPVEAVYVFPLEEGAAVCGFEAIVDNTLVVGEVKPRETAFEIYDDAMAEGHGAFLLDEERPDVFQASVGNLPPGKEVLLKLTYVTELTADANGVRFSIPTTVAPRYAPAEDRRGVGRSDAAALNPPVHCHVPYGLDLSVRVAMPDTIAHVASPSHPISVSVNGTSATVTLSQRDAALDRDFVLEIETKSLATPHAWLEKQDDGSTAIAVAFAPTFDAGHSPAEVVFVVDRSGSMQGSSIGEVRNALQLCLRSMSPGCQFNIVSFGSTYQALFPESRAYDDGSLAEASAHVATLEADLGGTEILAPLTFVLERSAREGLTRQVVVLTDGAVTNTDAVIALGTRFAASARVFTFGIGAGASSHLVRGLARAGRGAAEFIAPGERIEPKVVRQFGRLLSPALTDVAVDWGGLAVTQAPAQVPPVFAGGRVLVYGFASQVRAATARLTATGPNGPVSFAVAIDAASTRAGRTVATLAARERIRELEASPDWMRTHGSQQRARSEARVVREIIALATTYGLVSRETSFVAVERRETPIAGDVQLRRVPLARMNGWGDLRRSTRAPAAAATGRWSMNVGVGWLARRQVPEPTAAMHVASSRAESRAPQRMHELVRLQKAGGYWELDAALAHVIGRTVADLRHVIGLAAADSRDRDRAWATALALTWLDLHADAFADEWRMLARKARAWLDEVGAAPAAGVSWTNAAREYLRQS
jgi:Ca-activated chloride channel family protein